MPKAYWLAQNDVKDPETYKKYLAGTGEVFKKYGAKFLVRGGRHEALQGHIRARHVVIEFESMETALACYNDPAYQEAAQYRLQAAEGDIVIVEGAE